MGRKDAALVKSRRKLSQRVRPGGSQLVNHRSDLGRPSLRLGEAHFRLNDAQNALKIGVADARAQKRNHEYSRSGMNSLREEVFYEHEYE
jgi:hypothetical protein